MDVRWAALAEADRFPDRIEPAELARREDLRGLEVIVIDPADAKDHDDAVSWEPEPGGGGRLGVHIADVSWFVRPGSALDSEALARGVSAYLPDRVLPMLPPRLSGDLCSLVEGKDRLARTVFIEYDSRGNTRGGRICESVIRPAAGLDYDTVWGLLSDAGARHPRAAALRAMDEFAQVLRRRRFAAGSLDFNLGERKVELDAQGEPARVSMRRTNRAHWLIEEFMIAANEFTGHALARAGLGIWRIHEPPDMDDVAELEEFLAGFGVKLRRGTSGRSLRPQDFQAVLERFRGTREEFVVHRKVLQALKLARYAEFNEGHFGLALKDYTHFTSPIRRYADLAVHRLLAGRGEGRYTVRKLGEVARLVSGLERRAEEAERDCVGMLVMRLLAKRLGETVEGTVSRLEKWGAFVDLDDMGVEALLRSDDISRDRFRVSRDGMSMRGKRSGVTVQVGQRVRAIIARVDARLRQVDLAPEED